MNVSTTALAGVLVIEPAVYRDARGFFLETYHQQRYSDAGLDVRFVQHNHSRSEHRVLRGLHLQREHPQGKLVRASRGRVWDVVVDVDPASATFRRWVGVELDDQRHRQLYIPPGYAHGFCVLSDVADVEYQCTALYEPGDEAGIAWDDPELGIGWPIADPVLSARDRSNPTLAEYLAQ